jgi:hypothetical protein
MAFQRRHILIAVAFAIFLGGALGAYLLLNKDSSSSSVEPAKKEEILAQAAPKKIETQNTKETTLNEENQGSALIWALALSLCASIFFTLYLLRWRLRLPNGQTSIVPDELLKELGNQRDALIKYIKTLKSYAEGSDHYQKSTQQQLAELQQAFNIFQSSLDAKDQEIDRHRKGYDFHVYKKFVNKFVNFYIVLKREADAPENKNASELLNDMLSLFEDALDECNIEIITPDKEKSVEEQANIIGANKKYQLTNDQNTEGKIAKIIHPAFGLRTSSGIDILKEASVLIYSMEQSEAA